MSEQQNYSFRHMQFGIVINVEFLPKRKGAEIYITYVSDFSEIFSGKDVFKELFEHKIVRANLMPTASSGDELDLNDRQRVRKLGIQHVIDIASIKGIEEAAKARTPVQKISFAEGKGQLTIKAGRTFFQVKFSDSQQEHDVLFSCRFDLMALKEESGFVVDRAGFGSWKDQL